MTRNVAGWALGIPAGIALALAHGASMAGDRMAVEHSKQPTSAEGGLGYAYTFRVTKHGSGDPVDGAEFSIATDMPGMPGAHHMPHVTGEPTGEPGTYTSEIDFDMPGEWNLILRFSKPSRDQVVISDMIERHHSGKDHAGHDTDHSGHDMERAGHDRTHAGQSDRAAGAPAGSRLTETSDAP